MRLCRRNCRGPVTLVELLVVAAQARQRAHLRRGMRVGLPFNLASRSQPA